MTATVSPRPVGSDHDLAAREDAIALLQESLRAVSARYRAAMRECAAMVDPALSPATLSLVRLLHQHGTLAAGCAAHELMVDPSVVSRLVRQCMDLGLVEVSTDPDDRRSRLLSLTEAGQTAMVRLNPAIRDAVWSRLDQWPTSDVLALAELLGRVVEG